MRAERGFTLLEVLVSFVILALVLGAAYQSIGAGARSVERAERRLAALTIAESAFARIGAEIPFQRGRFEIIDPPWTARITLEHAAPRDRAAWDALGQRPYLVRVDIVHDVSGIELSQKATVAEALR